MKIELRNVKHSEFASQETDCFEASVYIDGKRAGTVSNAGHGGCNNYHPHDLAKRINAYAKTLPKIDMSAHGLSGDDRYMDQSDETLIGDLLNAYLRTRHEKRLCAKAVLYRIPGHVYEEGAYHSIKGVYSPAIKAKLIAKYGEKLEILNEKFA